MEALAAAEQEAARQAAAASALREAAACEAAMTAANRRRLDAAWLGRMRAAKLEELRAEACALARQHGAAIGRRDRLVEGLLEELAAQNTRHDAAAAAHGRVLAQLLDMQRARLAALHAQFTGDLRQVQAEFESEKAEMAALHQRAKKELTDVAAALQQSYADTRAQAAAAYRVQEEEVRNRASEAYNVTKLSLEGRVQELESGVEQQHQKYEEATGEQDQAYRELAAADAEAAHAIAQRTERLRHLQGTLVQWRGRIVANSSEWQRRNEALCKEKETVLGHHTALKAELARFRSAQQARLRQMCVSYASVEAGLQEHLDTAHRIIRVAALCRKHELPGEAAQAAAATAEEQAAVGEAVTPDADADLGDGRHALERPAAGSRPGSSALAPTTYVACGDGGNTGGSPRASESLAELGLQPGDGGQRLLDAFVRRINAALLDGAALEQERLRLRAENAALAAAVQAVREGSTVGPHAVEGPDNTLLIVNGLGGAPAAQLGSHAAQLAKR